MLPVDYRGGLVLSLGQWSCYVAARMRPTLIFLGLGLVMACGGGNSSMTPTTPAPTPPPGGTPAPLTVSMPTGASFLTTTAYVPDSLTVPVGTTVTFVNNDNVAHTTTSQNNLWTSPDMEPGASYSHIFQSAGSFPYYCIYHPGMVGTIVVQ